MAIKHNNKQAHNCRKAVQWREKTCGKTGLFMKAGIVRVLFWPVSVFLASIQPVGREDAPTTGGISYDA